MILSINESLFQYDHLLFCFVFCVFHFSCDTFLIVLLQFHENRVAKFLCLMKTCFQCLLSMSFP